MYIHVLVNLVSIGKFHPFNKIPFQI